MTNAERIRQMKSCRDCWLDWLAEEADEIENKEDER